MTEFLCVIFIVALVAVFIAVIAFIIQFFASFGYVTDKDTRKLMKGLYRGTVKGEVKWEESFHSFTAKGKGWRVQIDRARGDFGLRLRIITWSNEKFRPNGTAKFYVLGPFGGYVSKINKFMNAEIRSVENDRSKAVVRDVRNKVTGRSYEDNT